MSMRVTRFNLMSLLVAGLLVISSALFIGDVAYAQDAETSTISSTYAKSPGKSAKMGKLTIRYYANGATSDKGKTIKGKKLRTKTYSATSKSFAKYGLPNANGGTWKLSKSGYKPTKYWLIGSAKSKKKIDANKKYPTAAALAKALGCDLSKGNATVNLYVSWSKNPVQKAYTIKFNGNGGKGSMAAQRLTVGKAANLKTNAFTRSGYTFQGWAKTAKGTVVYKNKAQVKNLAKANKTLTLYAVWKKNATSTPSTSGGNTTVPTTPVLTTDGSTQKTDTTKYSYQIILPNGDSNIYADYYFPVLIKTDDPAWKQDKLLLRGWDSGSCNGDWGDYCDVNYVKQNGRLVITELGTQTDAGFLSRNLFNVAGKRELYILKDGKKVASKTVTVKSTETLSNERRAFLDKKIVELGIDKLETMNDKVNAVVDYGFGGFKYYTIFNDENGNMLAFPKLIEDLPWPFSGHLNCTEGSIMAQYMLKKVGVASEVVYGGYAMHHNLQVDFGEIEGKRTYDPSPPAIRTYISKVPKTGLDKWK